MKRIIPTIFLFICTLLIPYIVEATNQDVFMNNWNGLSAYIEAESLNEEILYMAEVSYSSAAFKDGFVMSGIDEKKSMEKQKTFSILVYNDTTTFIQKKIELENCMIIELVANEENIYAWIANYETGTTTIAKYDENLNKIKEVDFVNLEEFFGEYFFGLKQSNIELLRIYDDRLYICEESIDLDLNEKSIKYITEEEYIKFYYDLYLIEEMSNDEVKYISYDEKDTFKVYTAATIDSSGNEEEHFIRLYNQDKLVFEKTDEDILGLNPGVSSKFQILSVRLLDEYIVVFLDLGIPAHLMAILDYNGNTIKMPDFNALNINVAVNGTKILTTSLEQMENGKCPSYIGNDECLKVNFKEYSILNNPSNLDNKIIKLDGNRYDKFDDGILLEDGSYIAIGNSSSNNIDGIENNGSTDAIIVKYDKNGNILWKKNWGGSSNDYFNNIVECEDGNYLVVGHSNSTDIVGITNKGSIDGIVVKYDKDGNVILQKNYGGNQDDKFNKIIELKDGSYITLGTTSSSGITGLEKMVQIQDKFLLKFDKNIEIKEQIVINQNDKDSMTQIKETNDGGFVLIGSIYLSGSDTPIGYGTFYDGIIVKYDKNMNEEWKNEYKTDRLTANLQIHFKDIIVTKNDEYIVIGKKRYNTDKCYGIIIKYDKNGNFIWSSQEIGEAEYVEYHSVVESEDGSLTVTGIDRPFFGDEIITIVKYDQDGNKKWDYKIKTSDSNEDTIDYEIERILFLSKNKYALLGASKYTSNNNYDAIIYEITCQNNIFSLPSENGTHQIKRENGITQIIPLADEGYELDKIIIKDINGNEVEYYEENGKYYIDTMSDVNVLLTFKEKIINPNTITFLRLGFITVIIFAIYNLFISKKLKLKRYV